MKYKPSTFWRKAFGEYKAWLYLAPALIILFVFQMYPIIKSFLMGFYTEFDYLHDIVYGWGFSAR